MDKFATELRTWKDILAEQVQMTEERGGSLFWWYNDAILGAGICLCLGYYRPMYENIEVALAYWMAEHCK